MISSLLIILLITLGIGLPVVLMVNPNSSRIERIALSYLLGIGIYTIILYILGLLLVPFTQLNLMLVLCVSSILLLLTEKKRIINFWSTGIVGKTDKRRDLTRVDWIILAILTVLVGSSVINTLYWPVYAWDALAVYDFRAKLFSDSGYLSSAISSGNYWGYPLFTSLSHTIFYVFGSDRPQIIYTLLYLSLIVIFYSILRKGTSRVKALMGTLFLAVIPDIFDHSLYAYTNLPYTVYFSIGSIYILEYVRKQDKYKTLILGILLVGLSTWVRSKETFWIVPLIFIAYESVRKKSVYEILMFVSIFFPIQYVWKFIQNQQPIVTKIDYIEIAKNMGHDMVGSAYRLFDVLKYDFDNIVMAWPNLFIIFGMTVFYSYVNKIRSHIIPLCFIMLTFALIIAGTFLLSLTYPHWKEIGDSAMRLSMVLLPLLVYYTSITLFYESQN